MSKFKAVPLALALALSGSGAMAQTEPTAAAAPPETQPAPVASPVEASAAPTAPETAPAGPPGVLYTRPPVQPAFQIMRAGKMAFGALGAIAAIAESKKLMADNELQDPADTFRVELAKAYAAKQGLSLGAEPVAVGTGNAKAAWTAAQAAAKAQGARYLVDSGTQYWMSIYFPTDWAHYGMSYGAAVQVVDLSTGAIVAKGRCVIKPEKSEQSPTFDELMANKAEVLKKMSVDAAQKCAAILKSDTLKLAETSAAAP